MIQILVYEKASTVSMCQADALTVLRNVLADPGQMKVVTAQTGSGYIEVDTKHHTIVISPNER